jgi:hypothetical protein
MQLQKVRAIIGADANTENDNDDSSCREVEEYTCLWWEMGISIMTTISADTCKVIYLMDDGLLYTKMDVHSTYHILLVGELH